MSPEHFDRISIASYNFFIRFRFELFCFYRFLCATLALSPFCSSILFIYLHFLFTINFYFLMIRLYVFLSFAIPEKKTAKETKQNDSIVLCSIFATVRNRFISISWNSYCLRCSYRRCGSDISLLWPM